MMHKVVEVDVDDMIVKSRGSFLCFRVESI